MLGYIESDFQNSYLKLMGEKENNINIERVICQQNTYLLN